MIPWELLDSEPIAKSSSVLHLYRRGDEYSIRVDREDLMGSRQHGSEESLAKISCARIADRAGARVLVGGLGMGFTLRAALDALSADAEVVVAELSPAVIRWNQGPLAHLADHPLADSRVTLKEGDVAKLLRESRGQFDSVLLDVDNGPDGFTRQSNEWLYGRGGIRASVDSLRKGGVLGVWSAGPDAAFVKRLRKEGLDVDDLRVPATRSGGGTHTLWIATPKS
ncbi:MAG: hypothetical protein AAF488_15615 [Planctomycetota bacterium]